MLKLTYSIKVYMRKTRLLLPILAVALLFGGIGSSSAQNPAPTAAQPAPAAAQPAPTAAQFNPQFTSQSQNDLKALSALITEIQAQQKSIADNQALIDQKIATLTETIRTARIFTKRGGGGKQ